MRSPSGTRRAGMETGGEALTRASRASRKRNSRAPVRRPLVDGHDPFRARDAQRLDAPAVGARDAELEAFDRHGLATPRQATELFHHEPGDGVELLVVELHAEVLVELVDARDAAHGEL